MNTAAPASIELRGVRTRVDGEELLHAIDLDVLPGELLIVLGGSSAGKSALLRCIAGIDRLSAGSVRIDERDISGAPTNRRNIALLPQSFPLWPNLTVADNVAFAPRRRGLSRPEIAQRVDTELRFVGLQDFARHLPEQLSPAQQQRAALARTLAADSRVCLLDEPFGLQDAPLRERLLRLLRRRQQHSGQTMVLTTQDRNEALRVADRIALMRNGELQQAGVPADVYDNPVNRFVADVVGNANLIDGEIELVGEQAMFRGDNGMTLPLFDESLIRPRRCAAMFRPRDLRIVGGRRVPAGGQIRLSGRVEQLEFLGDDLRYGIDLGGTLVWMEVARHDNEPALDIGDRVALALDTAHIRILEH